MLAIKECTTNLWKRETRITAQNAMQAILET